MYKTKHKHALRGKHTSEYDTWVNMRARCTRTSHPDYRHYGGRGITICTRWDDFKLFLADLGMKPSKYHELDRIDNDGNYEPSNCRWTTRYEQIHNRKRKICQLQ